MTRTGRPKGSKQTRNESKYWLPEGVSLILGQTNDYVKETKLQFLDSTYGEFTSYFKALQDANASTHPKAIQARKSATNLAKYGTEHAVSSKIVRAKIKDTMISRYGVENPTQNAEIRQKSIDTFNANHNSNVTSPFGLKEIQDKSKQTLKANYNTTNPMFNEDIKAKLIDTCMDKYGLTNGGGTPDATTKRFNTLIEQGGDTFSSKGELEVRNFIALLGFSPIKRFVGGAKPFELDIFIPDLNIAFEFNGTYVHSEARKKEYRTTHAFKTNECAKKEIRLIHIFSHLWENKNEQIKGIIKSILRKNQVSIYARDCEIKHIDKTQANAFLQEYHLLGKVYHYASGLGLFYKNELVAVMTTAKHHRGIDEMLVNRFCVKSGFTIVGGLSRLTSHIVVSGQTVYTFIDKMYASPTNWINTGWELVKELDPDYFYFNARARKVVSKQSMKKGPSNNYHDGLSEHQYALAIDHFQVYDSGKVKLKYTKP